VLRVDWWIGRKIFVDSSLVQADASNNSAVDRQSLKRYLNDSYKEFEKRLEEEVKEDDSREDNDGILLPIKKLVEIS
jgi:hypothetical protein